MDAGVADAFALDPRSTLNRLRAVVYDWDIASDRLTWGPNAAETLAAFPPAALMTGAGFAELVAADSMSSRDLAIREFSGRDDGDGVPYRAVYRLAAPSGAVSRSRISAAGRPTRAAARRAPMASCGSSPTTRRRGSAKSPACRSGAPSLARSRRASPTRSPATRRSRR